MISGVSKPLWISMLGTRLPARPSESRRPSPASPRGTGGSRKAGGALFHHDEVTAAILLPAILVVLGAERMLFAPAHGSHPVGRNAERDEIVFHRIGAAL